MNDSILTLLVNTLVQRFRATFDIVNYHYREGHGISVDERIL